MINDYKVWNTETREYDPLGTDEQRKAVATLMRYCGQAVKMMYNPAEKGSSSAHSLYIPEALINYFDYKAVQPIIRKSILDIDAWEDIIYGEFAAGRPMVYYGQSDSGGHGFVCDGYDGQGLFHINWGWSGAGDGYFSLSVLNPYSNVSAGSVSIGFCIEEGAIIYTDPHMEPQPLLIHNYGSSVYQYSPIYINNNNIAEYYYTFCETYNEVADHALGTIDEAGNLHPLFMIDPNDSIIFSYKVYDNNYFKVEIDSTMFAAYAGNLSFGDLPLELNNDTLTNYDAYLENKSYLSRDGDQWYWNVELADRIGGKMSHWIPSDSLYLLVRQYIGDDEVKSIRENTGLKEYLAALPDNIGSGKYTFTYRMPVEVGQPGEYYFDSYLVEIVNEEQVSDCCGKDYSFTIDASTGIGIKQADSPADKSVKPWFDLQGHPLNSKPTRRGLYIQGNKILFIK